MPARSFSRCIKRAGRFAPTLAVLAAPIAVDAQQRGTGYRIGWIGNDPPDASKAWGWPPRLLISVVARARNHLQANRSLGFCFEILI